eukprot:TRINITY_DN2511_c1_g1_i2.p1 TRINITY_DN2511_c1_g1~~TRINITY_DN2511_c1_g1_i2.p1  ORF type:complete len:618 (+),score=72.12 TRINITY_DN2511_c1_g1_i2:78-1856(+)
MLTNRPQTFQTVQTNRVFQGTVQGRHLRKPRQNVTLRVHADKEGRQPWNFVRFVRTLSFYNQIKGPQDFVADFLKNFQQQPESVNRRLIGDKSADMNSGVIMVTGATGGVGKRVVQELLKKGKKVRGMVRNYEKAEKLLGKLEAAENAVLEVAAVDFTQRKTLVEEMFCGVERLIDCSAVIVTPKEGDTEDRQKYFQGIKFYDPMISGDTPEAVEFNGRQNLFSALKGRLGTEEGVYLLNPDMPQEYLQQWGPLDDVVMGGVSESGIRKGSTLGENAEPGFLFSGVVSTDNSGGFASVRSKNFDPVMNLSQYEGLELRLKGDGNRYKIVIRDSQQWDTVGYTKSFDTVKDEWQSIKIPFGECVPVFRAKTVKDGKKLNASQIHSLQLMLSNFEYDAELNPNFTEGPFALPVQYIRSYTSKPVTPKYVQVSSAGVTRFNRPGINIDEEPPAVRLNDQLGGILTYKLKGEDVIRESGVPFTIVRPCALTEEPAGAELECDQGDVIRGKIGREDIAQLCAYLLEDPSMVGVTFEIKSTVPFSTPFEIDPNNPPPPRDWAALLKQADLQPGVTGKTVDGVYTGRQVEASYMLATAK